MAGDDMGEKTEKPTPRRIQKSRQKGQVAKSQDLSSAIGLAAAVTLLAVYGSSVLRALATIMTRVIGGTTPGDPLSVHGLGSVSAYTARTAAIAVVPIFGLILLIAYLSNLLQVGWLFTLYPVRPSMTKMNPVSGVQRLFGMRNLVRSGVNFLKLTVVSSVAGMVLWNVIPRLLALPRLDAMGAMHSIAQMAFELGIWLLVVLLLLAILDFVYQKWQQTKDMKMTKHEVKDERRSMEGDPQVKKRRMKMAMDIAMQRINSAVPEADVVISNPTHFSVALRYDTGTMHAPRLVAKGVDLMAMRIRQVAAAHDVPIVERAPLARAIYWGVQEGSEIPPHLYEAVAEILAYVYRMEQAA